MNISLILEYYNFNTNLGTTAVDNFQEKNTTKCLKLNLILQNTDIFHCIHLISQPAVSLVPVTSNNFSHKCWAIFCLFLYWNSFSIVRKSKNRCTTITNVLLKHSTIEFLAAFWARVCSISCHVQLFATPWTEARQASLSFTISQSLCKLMSLLSTSKTWMLL